MKTKEKGLKGKLQNFAIVLFAGIIKLFPRLWLRFTKKSNPYATAYLPSVGKECSVLLEMAQANPEEVKKYVWRRATRIYLLKQLYSKVVSALYSEIDSADEFDLLLAYSKEDDVEKVIRNKSYTLNSKQVRKVCDQWPYMVDLLMSNQAGSFTLDLLQTLSPNALTAYLNVLALTGQKTSPDIIRFLVVTIPTQVGIFGSLEKVLKANLENLPKEAVRFMEDNFYNLFQEWVKLQNAFTLYDICFTRWREDGNGVMIDLMVNKAFAEKNWSLLSDIAWEYRRKVRFYDIVQKMVAQNLPCPKLLDDQDLAGHNPKLYRKALLVSIQSQTVNFISPKVVKNMEPDIYEKYIILKAQLGYLTFEDYTKLNGNLKDKVKSIQRENADIEWIIRHQNVSSEVFQGQNFSENVQMWMKQNWIDALYAYGAAHVLSDNVLKDLMTEHNCAEFLQSYFAKNPISDELKDCLMFSKNKFLLPDLQ